MTVSIAPSRNETPFARASQIADLLTSLRLPERRLSLIDLERVVATVAARRELFDDVLVHDDDGWSRRLFVDERVEVKVESWAKDHAPNWHDHGGSSGAFTVTSGALVEQYRSHDFVSVACHHLRVGDVSSFGPDHVHDVFALAGLPAVSLHAYSPPQPGMMHFEQTEIGFVASEFERTTR
jgi:hypothetical protein